MHSASLIRGCQFVLRSACPRCCRLSPARSGRPLSMRSPKVMCARPQAGPARSLACRGLARARIVAAGSSSARSSAAGRDQRLERQLAIARSDISSGQEHARGHYLAAQVKALGFAAERQLGRAASIDEQARDEFAVTFPPLDQAAIDPRTRRPEPADPRRAAARDSHRAASGGARSCPTRTRRHVCAEEPRLVIASLDACRQATATVIELPKDERVRGLFRSGMPSGTPSRDTRAIA